MTVAERQISWYRACRAGWLVLAAGNLLLGILNALVGHLADVAISATGVMILAISVAWISHRIRVLSRPVARPDYRLIARLEDEIYGERFIHAGAPDMTTRVVGIFSGLTGYWSEEASQLEWKPE